MGKLEKIVSSTKKHWKEIVTAIALPVIFNNSVNAGSFKTKCHNTLINSYIAITHITGATEGLDSEDVRFPPEPPSPPTIDIYSKVDFDPYKLWRDFRPPESTTTIFAEISGRGLTAPENATLEFGWSSVTGIGNFSWKNIIGELSQRVDDGNGGYKYALIGNYDIKYMVSSARTIPISINNGITQGDEFFPSHKLNYYFFNYADLNRDRKVDGLDFAIFAQNWGRNEESDPNTFGANVGSEPNDFDAYSDIDRNGIVDINDLSTFSGEWLWDANDPNTWSRVR
jgi:hypothetical protein